MWRGAGGPNCAFTPKPHDEASDFIAWVVQAVLQSQLSDPCAQGRAGECVVGARLIMAHQTRMLEGVFPGTVPGSVLQKLFGDVIVLTQ